MDIHAPSVASATQGPSNGAGEESKSVLDLIKEKDEVEAELTALGGVLESHGVNMDTSLITHDGFPRDDLDIAQIRTTRVRIIRLRNDYKSLMSRIETGLHEHFAKSKEHEIPLEPLQSTPATRGSERDTGAASRQADEEAGAAFAKVNSVVTGSPADQAGLKAGDEVRLFGDVNWLNHEKLARVARTVQRNEGVLQVYL
ncbi:MAG: hypothetical protein LQ340_002350 [Diploschistes diacapsis]|nr:MAG: hypothetical protein LQ340_002350 [Diploschistes diacapsis]